MRISILVLFSALNFKLLEVYLVQKAFSEGYEPEEILYKSKS